MFIPFWPLTVLVACAVFAYRYAETEGLSGVFWASLSVLLYLVSGLLLATLIPFGWFLGVFLQLGLFVLIRTVAIRRHGY
jgi:hypothetical protein